MSRIDKCKGKLNSKELLSDFEKHKKILEVRSRFNKSHSNSLFLNISKKKVKLSPIQSKSKSTPTISNKSSEPMQIKLSPLIKEEYKDIDFIHEKEKNPISNVKERNIIEENNSGTNQPIEDQINRSGDSEKETEDYKEKPIVGGETKVLEENNGDIKVDDKTEEAVIESNDVEVINENSESNKEKVDLNKEEKKEEVEINKEEKEEVETKEN